MRSTHSNPPSIAPITVTFNGPSGPGSAEFVTSFRIGRTDECDVCIKSDFVSRTHAEVVPDQDGWSIRDLNSSNGIYLQGEKVQRAALKGEQTVRLGKEGPEIRFTVAAPSASPNGRNPHPRLTVTLPVIDAARLAVFTVSGDAKRDAIAALRRGDDIPAARVRAQRIVWLVDAAASGASGAG